MWVYIQSEPSLWTVGHYDPKGKWEPESDHSSCENAARRCHYLNGGGADAELIAALKRLLNEVETSSKHNMPFNQVGMASPTGGAMALARAAISQAECK